MGIIDVDSVFCIIKDREQKYGGKITRGLQVALFSSIKNNPFLKECILNIIKNVKEKYYGINPLSVTGPEFVYRIAEKFKYLNKIKIIGHQMGVSYYTDLFGNKTVITKISNHNKIMYNNNLNKAYAVLWAKKKIYKNDNTNLNSSK